MTQRLLLTSFSTWLPEQQSNSSDDLLVELTKIDAIAHDLILLQQLPVEVEIASSQVIKKISTTQPDSVICCGMAEKRTRLSVESNASSAAIFSDKLTGDIGEKVMYTQVDLVSLVGRIQSIDISHDCGKFVCEGLYYSVLDYLRQHQLNIPCIFVHVPILTSNNLPQILNDFVLILDRMALS
ncbi:MAG: peptidase C15 [Cyanobacteria bacterium P01_A01_bin.84]